MRILRNIGRFFLYWLINMVLNIGWSIPAWLLLASHFIWDISIWWFVGGLGLWALVALLKMLVISWAAKCSSEKTPYRENKNPYSAKNGPAK